MTTGVRVLNDSEVDPNQEAVDTMLTEAEEAELQALLNPASTPKYDETLDDDTPDPVAKTYPTENGVKAVGRAVVRRAWMWNGTETLLPLAWNPDGTIHDGARRYLLKRHCLCCGTGGWRARSGQRPRCPACLKKACSICGGSTDPTKIIASFYLQKSRVPFPANFYGSIPCFMEFCPRAQSGAGFLTESAMRIHATHRHKDEYKAKLEAEQAQSVSKIAELETKLNALLMSGVGGVASGRNQG